MCTQESWNGKCPRWLMCTDYQTISYMDRKALLWVCRKSRMFSKMFSCPWWRWILWGYLLLNGSISWCQSKCAGIHSLKTPQQEKDESGCRENVGGYYLGGFKVSTEVCESSDGHWQQRIFHKCSLFKSIQLHLNPFNHLDAKSYKSAQFLTILIHTISNESWESKISIHYFTTTKKRSCPNTSDLDSWWANRSLSALWGSGKREQHRWTFIKPRDQRALPVGVDIKRLVGLFWSQAAQSSLCVSQWGFLGFQQNRLESQDLCEGVTFPLVQGQIGVV